MFIDIKDFREKYHFTQEELSGHLNISASLVAKAETGKRKLPKPALELLQQLAAKYNYNASVEISTMREEGQVTFLNPRLKERLVAQYEGQLAKYFIELAELRKKLKSLPKKYKKYQTVVIMAEEQLAGVSEEELKTDHFITIAYKRNQALRQMQNIILENPALIALKINQLESFLETAEKLQQLDPGKWLKFGDMALLPPSIGETK